MSNNHDLTEVTYDVEPKDDTTYFDSGIQTPTKSDDTAISVVSAQPTHYRVYKRRWLGLIGFVGPS